MKALPMIFAAISVLLPFVVQKTGLSEKYGFKTKMLCAFMYLITGIVSAFTLLSATAYTLMILGALIFGVLGDFFLSYKNDKHFITGVIFFAVGHLCYVFTFLFTGERKTLPHIFTVTAIAALVTLSLLIFAKTRLILNGKKRLILLYVPVLVLACISALCAGIISIKADNLSLAFCLISGGILFFASDIMIGIDKGGIKRPEFLHNAVSYTYFPAQTLFALSILFQQ